MVFGCTHSQEQLELRQEVGELTKQVEKLKAESNYHLQRADYIQYESKNVQCDEEKKICDAYKTADCLVNGLVLNIYKDDSENSIQTCIVQKRQQCFKIQEKCIIDNYKTWQAVKKHREKQLNN